MVSFELLGSNYCQISRQAAEPESRSHEKSSITSQKRGDGGWSGRQDLNLRPHGPKPRALPDCATPRRK